MLEKFKNYIAQYQLFTSQDKLILALSGGVDSVVLMHLLHQTNHETLTAHCNFNLRGDESDADEELACKLAMNYNFAFFCRHFDTQAHASKHHLSTQLSARNLRYAWFERLRKANDYQYIITAHHADDNAETILYNLTKGTGIAGLHGIRPKNNAIVRPLLFATKSEILEYAKKHQLSWREDASNASDKYSRNHIRLNVIPELRKINPNFEKTLLQTSEKIGAVEQVFQNHLQNLEKKLVQQTSNAVFINYQPLLHVKEPIIQLFHILEKYNFNYIQTKNIFAILEHEAGKKFESKSHVLIKDRDFLVVTERKKEKNLILEIQKGQNEIQSSVVKLRFQEFQKPKKIQIPTSENKAYLDAEKLTFPLTLRAWKSGDIFQPLGMKGMKKVSDFLNDKKIPNNLKSQILVLCSGNKIVWVMGFRLDDRFKITKQTQRIFSIEME